MIRSDQCDNCQGDGWYIIAVADENGEPTPSQEQCEKCLGQGYHEYEVPE